MSSQTLCHQRRADGWLHLCNGLDPVRDGGMVPSILGMTGALGRLRGEITIVTPTPSRLNDVQYPRRTDAQRAGDRSRGISSHGGSCSSSRSVAITYTPRCSYRPLGPCSLPDHRPRYGRAVGLAP